MTWSSLRVSVCGTHHVDDHGRPAYAERFDEALKFHPPGLAPVRHAGLAWHVRADGTPAYARRFERVFGFYEGLASVVATDGWFHITTDGGDAYPARHAWCGNFQQGRCVVRENDGTYHHIDCEGLAVYPERWAYVGDYRDQIAVVQAADGHSTHIDLDGSFIHRQWFVDLDVFHKGFARARDAEGWMHVDLKGRPAYARRFLNVEPFYNGQARVECFDGALEVIDERGTTTHRLRPPRRSEFADLSADMVGFWRTQAIAAAVELGVIDALPATESEVSARCRLEGDGTRRLLRALGELGLTAREADRWILTARGHYLRTNHPMTLRDAALEYAGPFTASWRRLPNALRRDARWTPPDVFGDVALDDDRRAGHHRMLRSYARHDYGAVCDALDLRGTERVLDAGGGLGVLAQHILDAYPSAEVTVLERPEVVEMAQPVAPAIRWRSGSLFEPWGVEADVVLLSRVLHDWDDAQATQILRHARYALPHGGRIAVIEMLLSDEGVSGALCDLHLLVATGGRERTVEQFARLLTAARFELTTVRRLPALPSVLVGVAS